MIPLAYALLTGPLLLLLALAPLSELVARLRRRSNGGDLLSEVSPADPTPRLLFLVPAHDEERLIAACVRSLLAMAYPMDRRDVIVIADNCEDATAEVASGAGARCLVRRHPDRPGKPAAIAWALDRVCESDWDACVIVDADSVVDRGFASRLAEHDPLEEICVQGYFDLSNETASWLTRLAGVLARVRYERMYPLKRASGLNCPLTGNGMCIGRRLLDSGWPALSLTENWELYARWTAAGVAMEYEPRARLYSEEASSLGQAETQRKRWLAGRIWVLRRYLGDVLGSRKIDWHQKLDVIAELASPPPVLHGLAAAAIALTAPLALPGGPAVVFAAAATGTLIPLIVHTASVVRTHPERWRIAGSLLLLPAYAAWRVIMAARTFRTLREGRWKKTDRGPDPGGQET